MKGRDALLLVVASTALVITPLVLGGAYLGLYVGGLVGVSPSLMAIAFSTAGLMAGFAVLFRVVRMLAGQVSSSEK